MEDFFYLSLGFAVCAAPFIGVGFLVTLLRKPKDDEARERLDAVESQLAWVRSEGARLGQRIVALEAREKELTSALAEARRVGAATRPVGVSEAHAAVRQDAPASAEATATATAADATSVAETATRTAVESGRVAAEEPAVETGTGAATGVGIGAGTGTESTVTDAAAASAVSSMPASAAASASAAPSASAAVSASAAASASEAVAVSAAASVPASATASVSASAAASVPASGSGGGTASGSGGGTGTASGAEPEGEGWERWIGVRGAAALGACVLVIAAMYFFQFSIEHGWIGPFMRVLIGLVTGTACVVGSEPLRRRYAGSTSGGAPIAATLANWLAGAGIAILYASAWAASGLYHLVPTLVSGIAMVAITGACAGLAVYRDSLAIAVLGLFGGFLTPIALSTGEDRPVSLFTYLFLLDAALLFLAQKKRWPALAALALAFTAFYQLAWIFGRMDEATTAIGLVITVLFAGLFAGVTLLFPTQDDDERESLTNRIVRVAAVIVPFVLAIAFAGQRGLAAGFGATLLLSTVATLGASLVSVRDRLGWLAPTAASFAVGLLLVYVTGHLHEEGIAWQALALACAPALCLQLAVELRARGVVLGPFDLPSAEGLSLASLIASVGASLILAGVALADASSFAWWTAGLVVLSLLALRVALLERWSIAIVLLALLHGSVWCSWTLAWATSHEPVRLAVVTLLALVHLSLYQGVALLFHREGAPPRDDAEDDDGTRALVSHAGLVELAAALGPALLLLSLTLASHLRDVHLWLYVGASFVLGLFVLMPAMRAASPREPGLGVLALVAAALVAFVHLVLAYAPLPLRDPDAAHWLRFGASAAGVVVFTVLPTLSPRLSRTRWAWRAAAIAPMLWFPALHQGWTWAFGTTFVGALPVLLALLTLALVAFARGRNADDPGVRTSALVWLSGATMTFVTVAIPLQLDREWITIGWALEAAALLALYRRLDHPGLKWVAMALFLAVCSRLLLNPYVLGYYERSPLRIFNWLSYTYLVPVVALVAGGLLLRVHEAERLRPWERALLPGGQGRPFTAVLFALALLVAFAWLNLTIVDWYATGPALSIPTDRLPARDLTISIAWALYGLLVLSLGMWRESTPMRVTSLLLVLLTVAKVFLYDLSNLRDLYRVAALVGLALSLITISLAYQRFVFKKPRATAVPGQVPPREMP